jgi:hypothetical protein
MYGPEHPVPGLTHANSEVLPVVILKTQVLWNVTVCGWVCGFRRFDGVGVPSFSGSNNPRNVTVLRGLFFSEQEALLYIETASEVAKCTKTCNYSPLRETNLEGNVRKEKDGKR